MVIRLAGEEVHLSSGQGTSILDIAVTVRWANTVTGTTVHPSVGQVLVLVHPTTCSSASTGDGKGKRHDPVPVSQCQIPSAFVVRNSERVEKSHRLTLAPLRRGAVKFS